MNILLIGYGAMGKRLETIIETSNHTLIGIITSQTTKYPNHFEKVLIPDIIIDFSHYAILDKTLEYAKLHHIPLIIATTGHSNENLEKIKSVSQAIPLLLTTNTSYGVSAIVKLLKVATPLLKNWDIEIIEKHHNKKMDAPSGTAHTLVETIESSSGFAHEKIFERSGLRKRTKNEISVHSVRGGTIIGEHSILFCGQDELIEIKHSALSKDVFAYGALKMAELLVDKPPQLYTMQDLIQI